MAVLRGFRFAVGASASALSLLGSGVAWAAEAGEAHEATMIEPIIVTAQRRESDIQSVPFSITALSGEQLGARHVQDFDDLSKILPGITFLGNEYRNFSTLSLRGANTATDGAGVDPGVSVYVDDVPTVGLTEVRDDFFDLDRVEVLRGPQGTLFGRNVTGGLIAIHTRAPSFKPEFDALAGFGSYNDYRAEAFMTGPLSETLAGKLSLSVHGHDGYLRDVAIGGRFGKSKNISGRAQLLYQPTAGLKILVGVDFIHEEGDSFGLQFYGTAQPNPAAPILGIAGGVGPGYPTLSYSPGTTNAAARGKGMMDNYSLFARTDYTMGLGTLTSITAFRSTSPKDSNADKLGLPAAAHLPYGEILESVTAHNRQVSEELRLASPPEQRFRWIGGLFLLSSSRSQDRETSTPFGLGVITADNNLASYAVFGEVSYDLTPKLTATLGGRYTWEKRNGVNTFPSFLYVTGFPITSPYHGSFEAFTPKATLTYTPRAGAMVYATVARGFKSGGFDDLTAIGVGPILGTSPKPFPYSLFLPPTPIYSRYVTPPYAPETAWNYEVGAKTSWFGQRLQVNASIFRQEYRNLQGRRFDAATLQYLENTLPRSRVQGVELETIGKPAEWLTIGAAWTYQDGKALYNNAPAPGTTKGPLGVPRNAVNLFGEVTLPISNAGKLAFGGDVTVQGKHIFNVPPQAPDPAFIHAKTDVPGLVNLHAAWTPKNSSWTVSVWGKNVTNVRYLQTAIDLGSIFGNAPGTIENVLWNKPATFGATVAMRW